MKRVLISQNEKNNGTDYIIVNGIRLTDEDSVVKYGREISKTDDWDEIYKDDDYLEIRKSENQLLIKSFYNEKDIAGRTIYYIYLIEDKFENIDNILNFLEQDSQLIDRNIDREHTQGIIYKIKNDEKIKKKIVKYVVIAIGAMALVYLLTKIK